MLRCVQLSYMRLRASVIRSPNDVGRLVAGHFSSAPRTSLKGLRRYAYPLGAFAGLSAVMASASMASSGSPSSAAAASAPGPSPFPVDKLHSRAGGSEGRQPVVLLSCGSFNPPTVMHLRMFEIAACRLKELGYDVWGGYMSPVNDGYKKPGLAPGPHRLAMCRLAAQSSDIIMVDDWEAAGPQYRRTLEVLAHVQGEVAAAVAQQQRQAAAGAGGSQGQHQAPSGPGQAPRVMLLCGADMLATFHVPGLWEDPAGLLQKYGIVVIAREGTDLEGVLSRGPLAEHRQHVLVASDGVPNAVSSSAVRREIASGRSVKYLLLDPVIEYISRHGLYSQQQQQQPAGANAGSSSAS